MNKLVIIHGWGDELSTLKPLARALQYHTDQDVVDIFLGDYVTLDDDVRMSDLTVGFDRAWHSKNLHRENKVNLLAYSTGALIIRNWLHQFFTLQKRPMPIENLVMVAPANFGSPLAHKGKSFIGRVTKGFGSDKIFETGKQILDALEMASSFTWQLAERDRFQKNPFNPKEIRTTVLVGNKGHGGIKSIANEVGSDGVVYTCTASMKAARIKLDYSGSVVPEDIQPKSSLGTTAFRILDELNHSSAVHKDNDSVAGDNIDAILRALRVDSAEAFAQWQRDCEQHCSTIMKNNQSARKQQKHGFQNTVFRVLDNEGEYVEDYLIEFYADDQNWEDDRFAEDFNTEVVTKVHVNKTNAAYRSFLIDCHHLYDLMKHNPQPLHIRITATPDIDDEKNHVGYQSLSNDKHPAFIIQPQHIKRFFKPNRTLLFDITLERKRKSSVFELRSMSEL